jgi:hypothetical protein
LGTFFAKQAKGTRRFVIETHSDYLVDRIRMEVRRKLLRPEDVSLLYFERGKSGAAIHNLELDANGSITNPPAGFRQFFLKEERDLLVSDVCLIVDANVAPTYLAQPSAVVAWLLGERGNPKLVAALSHWNRLDG